MIYSFMLVALCGLPEEIRAAEKAGVPLVVYSHASWCGPCKLMDAALERMKKAGSLKGMSLYVLDVDRERAGEAMRSNAIPQLAVRERVGDAWRWRHLVGVRPDDEIRSFLKGSR